MALKGRGGRADGRLSGVATCGVTSRCSKRGPAPLRMDVVERLRRWRCRRSYVPHYRPRHRVRRRRHHHGLGLPVGVAVARISAPDDEAGRDISDAAITVSPFNIRPQPSCWSKPWCVGCDFQVRFLEACLPESTDVQSASEGLDSRRGSPQRPSRPLGAMTSSAGSSNGTSVHIARPCLLTFADVWSRSAREQGSILPTIRPLLMSSRSPSRSRACFAEPSCPALHLRVCDNT